MQGIIGTMTEYFAETKLAGSYFALFLLSLFILYYHNREKNRGYLLYAVLGACLVYANPLIVYLLGVVFPVLKSYSAFAMFVPVLLYVPFAGTELIENCKEFKTKIIAVLLILVLIAVSGNMFGFSNTPRLVRPNQKLTKEQQQVVDAVTKEDNVEILADETIAPYLRAYADNVTLLYGKDLWTAGMDLGIMDEYSEEMTQLYEAMKNPQDTFNDIVQMAALYDCDILVIKQFDSYPLTTDQYMVTGKTANYLIYQRKD